MHTSGVTGSDPVADLVHTLYKVCTTLVARVVHRVSGIVVDICYIYYYPTNPSTAFVTPSKMTIIAQRRIYLLNLD